MVRKGLKNVAHLLNVLITNFRGELAALSAAFLWASATAAYGRIGRHIPPLELNLVKGIIAITTLLLTLILRGDLLTAIEPLALGLLLLSGVVGIGLVALGGIGLLFGLR